MRPEITLQFSLSRDREMRPRWSRRVRLYGWPEILGVLGVILVMFFYW